MDMETVDVPPAGRDYRKRLSMVQANIFVVVCAAVDICGNLRIFVVARFQKIEKKFIIC